MQEVRCKLLQALGRHAVAQRRSWWERASTCAVSVEGGSTFEQSPSQPSVVVGPCGAEVDSSKSVLQVALTELKDGPSQAINVIHIHQISKELPHVLRGRQRRRWRLHLSQCMTEPINNCVLRALMG